MNRNRIIRVYGSITKKESVVAIKSGILENTFVAEANMPYSGYYGNVPGETKPNSLFLFTECCYSLEEILRFSQKSDTCLMKKINLATGMLCFENHHYPVIRVKNFPDYDHLSELQKCFIRQGVNFGRKVQMEKEATIRINKCFELEEAGEGIYFDLVEKDKGYVMVNRLLSQEEFDDLILKIRNNSACHLFDAVKCGIIMDSEVKEMIRIFAERLDVKQLDCIKNAADRLLV